MQSKPLIEEIPISKLYVSTLNVRKDLSNDHQETSINDLAENIRKHGLLTPICVRKKGDQYEIFAGQRRFLAIRMLSWDKIPALIFDELISDEEIRHLSFSENIQRNDMSQKDKIDFYYSLYLKYGSVSAVSKLVNVSERTVNLYLKIKNNLNNTLLDQVTDNKNNVNIKMASSLSSMDKKQQQILIDDLNKLESPVEKLNYIRSTITSAKSKKVKISSNPSVILPNENTNPSDPQLSSSDMPFVFDRNNKKLIIPPALYIEISDLVNDYKFDNYIDD
jgi:ParB/RepB/Spo0J family partition protein